jgi:TonB family protein
VVVAVAAVLVRLLRRRAAAERHAVWLFALIALLLLPFGAWAPTKSSVAVFNVASSAVSGAAAKAGYGWAGAIWLLGAAVCLLRIAVELVMGWRTIRNSHGDGDVRYASRVSSPMAWGIGTRVMLLPPSAMQWQEDLRRVVLLHETAHLRRNDCLALLIAEIACALYWCNPLVWYAARELRREQEHAADDEVLAHGIDPATYAGHLVALARSQRAPLLAAGAVCHSDLKGRVESILDEGRVRTMLNRRRVLVAALALVAIALPLAAMQARKVHKIGGDVTPPQVMVKNEPTYTDAARDAKIQGAVVLNVVIEANGRIEEVSVERSLDPDLDANAMDAVRTWEFAPARLNGEPVAVSARIEVNFRLK